MNNLYDSRKANILEEFANGDHCTNTDTVVKQTQKWEHVLKKFGMSKD
jgi:hypothetical protein